MPLFLANYVYIAIMSQIVSYLLTVAPFMDAVLTLILILSHKIYRSILPFNYHEFYYYKLL